MLRFRPRQPWHLPLSEGAELVSWPSVRHWSYVAVQKEAGQSLVVGLVAAVRLEEGVG